MKKMKSTIAMTMATRNIDESDEVDNDSDKGMLTMLMVTVMMARATQMIMPRV